MPEKKDILYYTFSGTQIQKRLKTRKEGLTEKEVTERSVEYGKNRLPEPPRTPWFILFVRQFKSAMIYILLIAAGISFLLGELIDMSVILAAVGINIILGFIQEGKAQRALEQLRKVITLSAVVVRNGQQKMILAEKLVPGDIVCIAAGDKVPGDIRFLEVKDLEINEAALTGESLPMKKSVDTLDPGVVLAERTNMAYTGTIVTKGSGIGIVTAIGIETEIGKIAALLKKTKESLTPLQKKLDRFSKTLAIIVVVLSIIIVMMGLIRGVSFFGIFATSVALAVAAIPEGMIIAVTVVLAIGMQRILKEQGLVQKLVAAETLGSTTVICTDKTGTLTSGEMQVVKLITWEHDFIGEPKQIRNDFLDESKLEDYLFSLKIGVVSNDAFIANPEDEVHEWEVVGNLTERALLLAGIQAGFDPKDLNKQYPRLDSIPFDSATKYMATLHKSTDGKNILLVKGAPEKILAMSSKIQIGGKVQVLDKNHQKQLEEKFLKLSKEGLRVMAIAHKEVSSQFNTIGSLTDDKNGDFIFLSFIGIKDALRPTSKETIRLCQRAGIKIVMITGDNKYTAQTIAKEVGLQAAQKNILEGSELVKLSDEQLKKKVKDITVYARVSPHDKLRIVEAWQANGEIVAMTGDGINDSPAIKKADIGVSLGSGTDVTKETADLIILDNDFKTIVVAVEEGRGIFDNIRKVVLYLLSDSFSGVVLIAGALVMGIPLPLAAAQILWINLITDGFPSLALTVEPKEKENMFEPPMKPDEPILNKESKLITIVISIVTGMSSLLLFYWFWKNTDSIELARTVVFATLGVITLIYVFSIRSLRKSIFSQNPFSNVYLIIAVIAGLSLQILAIYAPFMQYFLKTVPLNISQWAIVLSVSVLAICIIEGIKFAFNKKALKA